MLTISRPASTARSGFTLVEISIVMVIIALIVGGVMVGTNLLRSARLRNIMIDQKQYSDAVEQFRDKYKAYPGDMANATEIWGAANADYNTCAKLVVASTGKKTCNGDGNDSIWGAEGSTFRYHELFRFWQHLANAGLIDGTYTGVNACNTNGMFCYKTGINAPAASIRSSTWAVYDAQAISSSADNYIFNRPVLHHIMYYGGENGNTLPFTPLLTPKETWNIDGKFDDGLPGQGKIQSLKPLTVTTYLNANQCASSANYLSAKYRVDDTTKQCILVFKLPF